MIGLTEDALFVRQCGCAAQPGGAGAAADAEYESGEPGSVSGDCSVLLAAAIGTQGLEELHISAYCGRGEVDTPNYPVAPSLKKLTYFTDHSGDTQSDVVLHFLLQSHAATLENVSLHQWPKGPHADDAALLASVPNLRVLRMSCGSLPDLMPCRLLTTLTLTCFDSAHTPGAVQCLRALAPQLTDVDLFVASNGDLLDMVRALAASGRAAVQHLKYYYHFAVDGQDRDVWQRELATLLQWLPQLRSLRVNMPTPDHVSRLLALISPPPASGYCTAMVHAPSEDNSASSSGLEGRWCATCWRVTLCCTCP